MVDPSVITATVLANGLVTRQTELGDVLTEIENDARLH